MSIQFPEKLQVLFTPHRYKVLHGGRGAAKSWGIARALLIQGASKPLRILCAREIQKSIQDSVHRLLKDQIIELGLGAFYFVTETAIRGKNGTEFLFAGIRGQSIANLKSYEGVDICWVEEAQVVTKKSWDVLIPTIRKEGSEIWISFNPELDTDETYIRFVARKQPDSVVLSINWRDNPWFPKVLDQERRELQARDTEDYETIWEGKCRSVVPGAIYRREILAMEAEERFRPVPHDPKLKVHTVWDLGWNDQTSIILVQRLHSEVRIFDYIEDSHRKIADYVADLKDRRYNFGIDYLPHDAESADVKRGESVQDIMRKLGRKTHILPRLDVESGIKAARMVFPRVYLNNTAPSWGGGVRLMNCLRRYRRHINLQTNEPGDPLHDEYSHGADAFRYMALCVERMRNEDQSQKLTYDMRGIV